MSDPAALQALCQQGLAHHQAGRLAEAGDAYEQVLAADPTHFDALRLLGVQRIQTGRLDEAVDLLRRAIAMRADIADVFGNLSNALNSGRRHDEALAAADRALALNPNFAEAHGNRAQALRGLGRLAEAADSFGRAAALAPSPQAHANHAVVLRALARHEEVLDSLDRALALKPDYAEAWIERGDALRALGRPAEALASADRALTLKPTAAEAHGGRGNALSDLRRHEDALEAYDQAIALKPDYVEAHNNRAAPLSRLGRPIEALAAADRALALRPDYAEAHLNRGAALYDMRRMDEALESYDRAIALKPDYSEAHNNRGVVLYETRRFGDAMASYDRALALQPDYADAHHNQAICRLALGDEAAGWAQYEWRWRIDQLEGQDWGVAPLWLGEGDIAGRTILLRAEQGLGDTLQFCRYAADVAARGARVVMQVLPPLKRLMGRVAGVDQVIARGEPAPPRDLQIPMMSLPLALGCPPPDGAPYLTADPQDVAGWAERLAADKALRVGLCWAGGVRLDQFVAHSVDRRRSLPLAAFAPLVEVRGVSLYSLQKGPPAAQLAELQTEGWIGPPIADPTDQLADFADTAALIANLDLVITCDTAVAHVAGALGAPVWVLNRFDACWRWLDGRDDSPWYASARLFRQPTPGDWDSVSVLGRDALRTAVASAAPRP